MTSAPNQMSVSQALFSDSTSSQLIVPVIRRAKRPSTATTVGSSVKAGPKIIAGTLAQRISSMTKVPIITISLPDRGPIAANSFLAYETASGVRLSSGGEIM
ncbi:hypothetical protein D3C87_1790040 [compost metagenome]